MPNFERGVLTRSKNEVDGEKRVKIGRSRFWDDFENFRKFREHFIWKTKTDVLTNDMARLFKRLKNHTNSFKRGGFPTLFAKIAKSIIKCTKKMKIMMMTGVACQFQPWSGVTIF